MTKNQYLAAISKLGLTVASKRTAAVLGLSLRQCRRIGAGDAPVPEPVARLLRLIIKYDIDVEEVK